MKSRRQKWAFPEPETVPNRDDAIRALRAKSRALPLSSPPWNVTQSDFHRYESGATEPTVGVGYSITNGERYLAGDIISEADAWLMATAPILLDRILDLLENPRKKGWRETTERMLLPILKAGARKRSYEEREW